MLGTKGAPRMSRVMRAARCALAATVTVTVIGGISSLAQAEPLVPDGVGQSYDRFSTQPVRHDVTFVSRDATMRPLQGTTDEVEEDGAATTDVSAVQQVLARVG